MAHWDRYCDRHPWLQRGTACTLSQQCRLDMEPTMVSAAISHTRDTPQGFAGHHVQR